MAWTEGWTPSAPVVSGGGGRTDTPTSSPPSTEPSAPWAPGSTGGWNPESESPYKPSGSYSGGWGSFGTRDNWSQAFFSVHGRSPNAQDEVDYWDSQLFAAVAGRAPTRGEWLNRYWTNQWDNSQKMYVRDAYGNSYPVPANDGVARTAQLEGFIRFGPEGDEPPEFQALVQQIRDWAGTVSGGPTWLQEAIAPIEETTETTTAETVTAEAPALATEKQPKMKEAIEPAVPVLKNTEQAATQAVQNPTLQGWLNPGTWWDAARSVYGSGLSPAEIAKLSAEGWNAALGRNQEEPEVFTQPILKTK